MAEDWACKARPHAVEPEDCDWPNCGCDPHAERVMEGLHEAGWLTASEASRLQSEVHVLRALCGEAAALYATGGVFPVNGEMAARLHAASIQKTLSNDGVKP